jgi:hypothetical protein
MAKASFSEFAVALLRYQCLMTVRFCRIMN